MLKNLILATLVSLLFGPVWAESTVRFADGGYETAISRSGTNFVDIPATSSGDGSSSSSPVKFYVPIDNSDNSLDERFTLGTPSDYMPSLQNATTFLAYSRHRLLIDNDDGNVAMYAAIKKSDTEFLIFHKFSEPLSDGLFSINYANICTYASNFNSAFNCDDYDSGNSGTKTTQVYLFQSTDNAIDTTAGNLINPSSTTGGLFLEIYWATKLPGGTSSVMTQTELKKGDQNLRASYTSTGISSSDIKQVFACVKENSSLGGNQVSTQGCFRGTSLFKELGTTATSGEGTIRDLTNGVTYFVSVGIETNYHVATLLSNEISQSPLQIEALLAKQQCYILSAGFQEEHFVVDFYKMIRDRFLYKFSWGQSLIYWYYKTAPQYTQFIINSDYLAFAIRMMAYFGMMILFVVPVVLLAKMFKLFLRKV